jgi:hypothetical protein
VRPKVKHSQTLTETWPGSAGSNGYTGQSLAWVVGAGNLIIDNAAGTPNTKYARVQGADGSLRSQCSPALDTINHQISLAIEFLNAAARNNFITAGVRAKSDGTDNCYRGQIRNNTTPSYLSQLLRRGGTGGNGTLVSDSSTVPDLNGTIVVTMNGSTLTMTYGSNINQSTTATDATLDAFLRCYIGANMASGSATTDGRLHANLTLADVSSGIAPLLNLMRRMKD